MLRKILTCLLLGAVLAGAESRDWRSADGSNTIKAKFVSTDGKLVTLQRADGRLLTLALSKLHTDDQGWVNTRIPAKPAVAPGATPPPDPSGAAFGNLEFGDDRKEVEEKLLKSSLVETAVSETFFGRTGLNGVFRTKAAIGGLQCYLYFDWTDGGGLREVTLQTQPVEADRYPGLRDNWDELINLLSKLHGSPLQGASYPRRDDLQDGLILNSHLWRTEEGHCVLLGTGQERDKYNVVVRITTEQISPRPIPAQ